MMESFTFESVHLSVEIAQKLSTDIVDGAHRDIRGAQGRAMDKSRRAFEESYRAAKRSATAVEAFQRALQESEEATSVSMDAERKSRAALRRSEVALADSKRAVVVDSKPKAAMVDALKHTVKALRLSQEALDELEEALKHEVLAVERLKRAAMEQDEALHVLKEAEKSVDAAHSAVGRALEGSEKIVEDVEEALEESEGTADSIGEDFDEPVALIDSWTRCAGLCRKSRVQDERPSTSTKSPEDQTATLVKLLKAQKGVQAAFVAQMARHERLLISNSAPTELVFVRRNSESSKVLIDMMEKLSQLRLRELLKKTLAFKVSAKL